LEDVRPYLSSVDNIARQNGATLITGIPTRQGNQTFNSVIALGQGNGIYHKRHLVPFGEYVPLENWLRGLIRFFDLPMSAFTSGNDQQPLLRVKSHPIATAICYEIVYQDLVAKSARDAEIILTVSNDTWFGSSFGPHQHFQIARMRAIENRKPLIRATNDGISALINEQGLVSNALPQFQRDSLTASVTTRQGTTPFNHTQSWPILIISVVLLVMSSYRKADKATASRQT
jgi:apolipoprotein N-acyltransferase